MALETEIKTFETMKESLMQHHRGKFAVIRGEELIGTFDTFDTAAREAVKRFGNGPYLIRLVRKEAPMPMPASVAYRDAHASH